MLPAVHVEGKRARGVKAGYLASLNGVYLELHGRRDVQPARRKTHSPLIMPPADGSSMAFKGRQHVCRVWTQTGVPIFDFDAMRDRTTAPLHPPNHQNAVYLFGHLEKYSPVSPPWLCV